MNNNKALSETAASYRYSSFVYITGRPPPVRDLIECGTVAKLNRYEHHSFVICSRCITLHVNPPP